MIETNKLNVSTPTDTQIVMTRAFDAPRQLVWNAMTKPELIQRWLFSPPDWKMVRCDEDLRVGGSFRWEWVGPDGQPAMSMHGVYREVSPPAHVSRTEFFEMGCNEAMGDLVATIDLAEKGGKTHLTMTLVFASKEARDGALASGMDQGVSAGYDQLDALLAAA